MEVQGNTTKKVLVDNHVLAAKREMLTYKESWNAWPVMVLPHDAVTCLSTGGRRHSSAKCGIAGTHLQCSAGVQMGAGGQIGKGCL